MIGLRHRVVDARGLFVGEPVVIIVIDVLDDHKERVGSQVLRPSGKPRTG